MEINILMRTSISEKLIAYLALISGLAISAVAIYYSVVGLTSIFAAAVVPVIIMGVVLEVSKLVATVWLKQNWSIAPMTIKTYLIGAIFILMLITSLGIFGFLSKAHSEQNAVSGAVISRITLIDEKIKIEKENIDAARKSLAQMDAQVDQRLSRSSDGAGAERAVQIRRQQQAERSRLQKDIVIAQNNINKLNEERAPIASELRKVEAEVGPIKYLASFVYDTTDQSVLEKTVTWMIIIIVLVFDPLAIVLLLASQYSFQGVRESTNQSTSNTELTKETDFPKIEESTEKESVSSEDTTDEFDIKKHPYLFKKPASYHPPGIDPVGPIVYSTEKTEEWEPLETIDKPPTPTRIIESNGVRRKIFKRPDSYVQNEEQQESNLWSQTSTSNTISEDQYVAISKGKQRQ